MTAMHSAKSLRKDGIRPVIPGRANRKKRIRHDKEAYKGRNVIERCYCRLKDADASPPATTNSPEIIFRACASWPPSSTGCKIIKSGP